MQTTDAPTQVDLAKRMGLTKQAVCVRVHKMAAKAALLSPGIITRMKSTDPITENPENIPENSKENNKIMKKTAGDDGVTKKSIPHPPFRRGASTTDKKRRILKAAEQEGIPGGKL
jgi:hypothetical protein